MITELLIAAGALYLLNRKQSGASGIGAIKSKRRIWNEVEDAQRAGIDLTDKSAWQKHAPLLRRMANGKIKEDGTTPMEQRYFNQLSRAYKSIAGTTLPYKESIVRNENDDVILIYRDYDMANLPAKAAQYIIDNAESNKLYPEVNAYWLTIAYIALGKLKFIWKGDKIHRGIEQMVFGQSAPSERKQRISYLASKEKGGVTIDAWAHQLWEHLETGDTEQYTDGAIDAIRDCQSVGMAKEMCKQEYLKAHQVEEPLLYQDVPF
jgi:hypothetical protein